jgi:hypothetical protein
MRARIDIVRADPFGAFARAVARATPRRITIVSPWLNDGCERIVTLGGLVRHAARHHATIVLVTRPPASEAHARAIELVKSEAKSRVHFNPRLHAKLYVCEFGGQAGLAVVGSANGTGNSAFLDEVAVMIRPERESSVISELAGPTVRGLMDSRSLKR